MAAAVSGEEHQDLYAIRRFYELAYLKGRTRAGLPLSSEGRSRFIGLAEEMHGDLATGRRRHRRRPASLAAACRGAHTFDEARVLDMCAGGFLIQCSGPLYEGQKVQLKVRSVDTEYSFPCRVLRLVGRGAEQRAALALIAVPLEMRRGVGRW